MAAVSETGTVPSVDYLSTFFHNLSRDERFANVQYIQFNSIVSMEGSGTQQIFNLNPLDPPHCYDISDILMRMTVRILKADGSLPDKSAMVFPVNSSCLSAFESLQVHLNDVMISNQCNFYNYKSYIQNLISFSEDCKDTNLYLSGWITDNYNTENGIGSTEPTSTNQGMRSRNAWFRNNLEEGTAQPYSPEGFTFVCPLKHDLYGAKVLLPPGTKVCFTFTKSPNAWYLMVPQDSSDKEEYMFQISNCMLYVKQVTLNDSIYRSLKTRMEKEKIVYHYRKLTMKTEVLNAHSIQYESNNLFPDSLTPIRIYFMLVKNKSTAGRTYTLNPFSFIRAIKVPTNPSTSLVRESNKNAMQAMQMELLRVQQQAHQEIMSEIKRLRKKNQMLKILKHKKRSMPRMPFKAQRKRIPQCDGNETDELQRNSKKGVQRVSPKGKGKGKGKGRGKNRPITPRTAEPVFEVLEQTLETPHETEPLPGPSNEVKVQAQTPETLQTLSYSRKAAKKAKKVVRSMAIEEITSDSGSEDDYLEEEESSESIEYPSDPNEYLTSSDDNEEDDESYATAQSMHRSETVEAPTPLVHQTQVKQTLRRNRQSKKDSTKHQEGAPEFHDISDTGDENICFVESFQLDVNSQVIDQFSVPATKMQCPESYMRFLGKKKLKKKRLMETDASFTTNNIIFLMQLLRATSKAFTVATLTMKCTETGELVKFFILHS